MLNMPKSVCAICAQGRMGCEDCCTSPFTETDPGFWLTFSDIARIVKKTGLDPSKFCRLTELEDDEDDDDDGDEIYGDLVYLGEKVILMNPNGKKCFFLGEKGCKIFDSRPKMCQVYPFWFKEEEGKIKVVVQHEDSKEEDDCYLTKSNYKNYDLKFLLEKMNEDVDGFLSMIKEYIDEMIVHSKHKKQLLKKPMMDVLKDNGYLD